MAGVTITRNPVGETLFHQKERWPAPLLTRKEPTP